MHAAQGRESPECDSPERGFTRRHTRRDGCSYAIATGQDALLLRFRRARRSHNCRNPQGQNGGMAPANDGPRCLRDGFSWSTTNLRCDAS